MILTGHLSAFSGYPSPNAMWDPEGLSRGYSCFPYDGDDEDGNLDKLEAAAPEMNYKQRLQNQDLAMSEGHLSWPDSFFEWYALQFVPYYLIFTTL
jgi:hypothetical protein